MVSTALLTWAVKLVRMCKSGDVGRGDPVREGVKQPLPAVAGGVTGGVASKSGRLSVSQRLSF